MVTATLAGSPPAGAVGAAGGSWRLGVLAGADGGLVQGGVRGGP